jgi:hypothetical protein
MQTEEAEEKLLAGITNLVLPDLAQPPVEEDCEPDCWRGFSSTDVCSCMVGRNLASEMKMDEISARLSDLLNYRPLKEHRWQKSSFH